MGWRSVFISQPARLSINNRQLRLEQDADFTAQVPLEDIAVVVLETPQATITSALLAELASHDVAVITCDESHHPNGVLLPYLSHSRALRVLQKQLMLTQPQKKRAHQSIIQAKLNNQAAVLDAHSPGKGDFLRLQATRVRSGDPDNREGSGARYYFSALFGDGFTREQICWQNSALNYGYAILRAAIARSLVCYGFLPAFGLFHRSQLNAFNLADDLIEPLRPVVDHWVRTAAAQSMTGELSKGNKAALVQLLYRDVLMNDGCMNVMSAIDQMCMSLSRFCDAGDIAELDWPRGIT